MTASSSMFARESWLFQISLSRSGSGRKDARDLEMDEGQKGQSRMPLLVQKYRKEVSKRVGGVVRRS